LKYFIQRTHWPLIFDPGYHWPLIFALFKGTQYYYFDSITGNLIDEFVSNRIKQKNKSEKEAESRSLAIDQAMRELQKLFDKIIQDFQKEVDKAKQERQMERISKIINEAKAIHEQGLELYETGKSKEEHEKFALATKYYKQAVKKFKEAYDVQKLDLIFESLIDVIESFIRIKAYGDALEGVEFLEKITDQNNYSEKVTILNNIKKKVNDIKNNNVLQTDHLSKYKSESSQNSKHEIRNY